MPHRVKVEKNTLLQKYPSLTRKTFNNEKMRYIWIPRQYLIYLLAMFEVK